MLVHLFMCSITCVSVMGLLSVRIILFAVIGILPVGWRTRAEGRCVDCADSSGTWWASQWRLDLSGIEFGKPHYKMVLTAGLYTL